MTGSLIKNVHNVKQTFTIFREVRSTNMPKLSLQTNAVVSTTKEVRLAPTLRTKLLTRFHEYARLKAEADLLESKLDAKKAEIASLREDTGEASVQLEGFTSTLVAPERNVFDPKVFVKLGGDLDIYNQAVKKVPSKSYEKITTPRQG